MGTPAIVIAGRRAERDIVDYLRRERATHPERAVPLPELRHASRHHLERLLTARAVRETPNGFWLDEVIYDAYRSDRRGIVLVVLGIAAVALIGALIAKLS